MRFFFVGSAVLVALLFSLAWWRGGDRSEVPRTALAAPVPVPPSAPAKAPPERIPAAKKAAPSVETPSGREADRAAEENRLDHLRAEAARAVHSAENPELR